MHEGDGYLRSFFRSVDQRLDRFEENVREDIRDLRTDMSRFKEALSDVRADQRNCPARQDYIQKQRVEATGRWKPISIPPKSRKNWVLIVTSIIGAVGAITAAVLAATL